MDKNKQFSNWLLSLEQANVLNRMTIDGEEFLRLEMPGDFEIDQQHIKLLKDKFDPEYEKGGFILVEPSLEYETFVSRDVIFIPNKYTGDEARGKYSPVMEDFIRERDKALGAKLLPLYFHTHPTKETEEDNIIEASAKFLRQLGTSEQDQASTLYCFKIGDLKLRLPFVLVLENERAVFVGLFGGLVSPLCFEAQKQKIKQDVADKWRNKLDNWVNADEKTADLKIGLLFASLIGGLCLLIWKPKHTVPLVMLAGVAVPIIVYSSPDENQFLGISYGQLAPLTIHIPKLEDQDIVKWEMTARELQKKIEERDKSKAK